MELIEKKLEMSESGPLISQDGTNTFEFKRTSRSEHVRPVRLDLRNLHLIDNDSQIVEVYENLHLEFLLKMNFELILNQLNLHSIKQNSIF